LYDMAGEMVARCAAMVKRKVQLHIQDVDDDTRLRVPSADNYQLRLAAEGEGAGKLALCPTPRLALGDSQVEIEVLATGLNFKDVLFTTGLLRQQPGEA
ncbi:hypothetical protein Q2461_24715, partial [Escherichia coli]|nr:hypothetical protein [Escherichia coli]